MKNREELSQCDKKASTKTPIDDILSSERFSPKNGRKEMMLALIAPIWYIAGSSSHCSRARKRNKRLSNWKERSKSVSFPRGHDCLCENPEESTKKLIELMSSTMHQATESTYKYQLNFYILTINM